MNEYHRFQNFLLALNQHRLEILPNMEALELLIACQQLSFSFCEPQEAEGTDADVKV